jgi:hypothetical protein
MVYHKEIKIYRPILDQARDFESDEISLTRSGHILLNMVDDPGCSLECALGWENEKVTHLRLIPNDALRTRLEDSLTEQELLAWTRTQLAQLFPEKRLPKLRIAATA